MKKKQFTDEQRVLIKKRVDNMGLKTITEVTAELAKELRRSEASVRHCIWYNKYWTKQVTNVVVKEVGFNRPPAEYSNKSPYGIAIQGA